MKRLLYLLFFILSFHGYTQNNYIVKTEDGRRVLLKADYTWEYIDAASPKSAAVAEVNNVAFNDKACQLPSDFAEPKLDNKIQNQLKKGRATIAHVKKKVAKDYNCSVEEVILVAFSEQKSKGVYDFCARGKKVSYKRVGNSIIEKGKLF